MAGQGADLLGHLHIEEDGGCFGEGETGGVGKFVEGEVVVFLEGVEDFFLVGGEGGRLLQVVEGCLLADEGPSELEGDVVGIADEEGAVGGDEVVGAARVGVGKTPGEGKDIAVVAGGDGCGDEGTALVGGFDNDGGVGEGGDDAVACREVARVDGGAGGVFGGEGAAAVENAFGQRAVFGGVDAVQPVAEDGYGGQAVVEGSRVGGGVDAVGQAADDMRTIGDQIADKAVGVVSPLRGSVACAHEG